MKLDLDLHCFICPTKRTLCSICMGSVIIVCVISGKVGLIRTLGKFRHTFANSVNPDETAPYEPSYQDFHCLLSLFIFISIFEI